MKKTFVIAHRGGFGDYAENTLPAFKHALAEGVHALEMDVRFDYFKRRFFVEHDFFHPAKSRKNVLSKLLDGIPKDTFLVIDLKTARFFSSRIFVRHFVEFYEKHLKDRPVLLQSFNPFALNLLRRALPDAPIGFLCGLPFWNFIFKKFFLKKIRAQSCHLHKRMLNEKNIRFGRQHKFQIIAFVLNHRAEWERALKLGVDGIITDRPDELSDFLKTYGTTQ